MGGQYCHLIARKVRDLGVYAEVAASDTPASELNGRKGIIISGGPASVYDPSSPTIDPAVLASGIPVLGICYGQQLMSHLLGGRVEKGERGETRGWYLAEPEPGRLVATVLFVDRLDGRAEWVHPVTQGLLPMSVWHLDSRDGGRTWGDRRRVDLSPWPGASPTGELLVLPGGVLAQPFEHWKEYEDPTPGVPAAHLRLSRDGGRTWPDERLVARDPANAIFYWDQRIAAHPATGRLVAKIGRAPRLNSSHT